MPMQLILREDVDKLGKSGELVNVKPGFGRNYLLPRGLAVVATKGNVQRIAHEKQVAEVRAGKARKEAEGHAASLQGVEIVIARPVGEENKLFGSVTARDIAEALAAKGHKVDHKKIQLPAPIRLLGKSDITVKLAGSVSATIVVEVTKKE
jgi:large subunit ribosomal protein L9